MAALFAAASAHAAVTVATGAFITAPTAYNGFEDLPGHFTVPYDEQGIDVKQVTAGSYNEFNTGEAYQGTQSFYTNDVDAFGHAEDGTGYLDITLQSGADFPAIQFAVGSGIISDDNSVAVGLNYQLFEDGAFVQGGVAGPVPDYTFGFNLYGFYGGAFDEVRLQVNGDGVFGDGALDAGIFDAITVGPAPVTSVVPEPGLWALLILGFGLTGQALRRRRDLERALVRVRSKR